jgi:hypothetical protein
MQFCPSDDEKWSLSSLPTSLCKMDFALEEMLCNCPVMQAWREFDVGDIEPRNTALCYHLSRTESHPVWRQKLWSSILWQSWGTDRGSVELSLVQTGWVFRRSVKKEQQYLPWLMRHWCFPERFFTDSTKKLPFAFSPKKQAVRFLEYLFLACLSQLGNYASLEGVLYCRPHFEQLLKTTGSFDKSFDTKTGTEGMLLLEHCW